MPRGEASEKSAPAIVGNCTPGRTKYKTQDDNVSTDSTGFVNVAGSGIVFNQGGFGPSCVIVRFSAQAFASEASGGRLMYVRTTLGSDVGFPADVQFTANNQTYSRAHSFEWIFPNVPPGKHTVRIQWRSNNGQSVFMQERTTVLQFTQ